MDRIAAHAFYKKVTEEAKKKKCLKATMRKLVKTDRFYLLVYVLGRKDADSDWVYARCREVEANPNGFLDLWAREHYKSTIISYCGTIQEVCKNPEITIGIFSFNRPIAKSFLVMIKTEMEKNEILKWLFPEIFWADPIKDSRKYGFKWSEDSGITVKRKSNPNEKTVEAWGMIDAQPTSKHFMLMIYNDVVTDKTVLTDEMIRKTTAGWELSQNLGRRGGHQWYEGTIYHFAETYATIIKRGIIKPRFYPATDDGTLTGKPVYLSEKELADKRANMGAYTFACQMLLNPTHENKQGFEEEWIHRWDAENHRNLNKIIIVDPASKKKKKSDWTSIWVIGLGSDNNYYVIDGIRDKLNLTERTEALFRLHQQYRPKLVGYEEYGMQTDVEHIEGEMGRNNYRFHIVRLGGTMSKIDRILKLVPIFEQGRVYFPEKLMYTNWEKKYQDLVSVFINDEYLPFPFGDHDDMLDCLARMVDPKMYTPFPEFKEEGARAERDYKLEQDEREWNSLDASYG